MRVYLPTTLTALASILESGELGPAPLHGYAVTPALRESYASGDEEELEYVAMLVAARESLRQLASAPEAPRRRVVLAADVPDAGVTAIAYTATAGDGEPAAVTVSSVIPLSSIASGHVDDEAAVADVAAAAEASAAADAGDADAEFTVDGAEGHELGWYATQELHFLA